MMHQLVRQLLLCMALVWRKLKAASSGKKNMGSTKSSSQIQRAEVFFTAAGHLPRPTRLQLYVSCHKHATLPEVPISLKALWILLFILMHCNMIWVNITEQSKQSWYPDAYLWAQTEVSCVRSKQLLDNGDPTIHGDDFCKSAAWQTLSSIYESTRTLEMRREIPLDFQDFKIHRESRLISDSSQLERGYSYNCVIGSCQQLSSQLSGPCFALPQAISKHLFAAMWNLAFPSDLG